MGVMINLPAIVMQWRLDWAYRWCAFLLQMPRELSAPFQAIGYASPISGFDSGFSTFAQGFVALGSFRLSYITFYALIAVAFVWVLWNKTRFGKNIFAIGGNPEAAKVSGVNVGLNLLMIYALSGVFYAFGGMLEAGRIGSATN
jgi:methyl-galactoside transport system permease protein